MHENRVILFFENQILNDLLQKLLNGTLNYEFQSNVDTGLSKVHPVLNRIAAVDCAIDIHVSTVRPIVGIQY